MDEVNRYLDELKVNQVSPGAPDEFTTSDHVNFI